LKFLENRLQNISKITEQINTTTLKKQDLNAILTSKNHPEGTEGCRLANFIKRPDMSIDDILSTTNYFPSDEYNYYDLKQAEIVIKYEGYISREKEAIERAKKNEEIHLPINLDFCTLTGMRREAIEKLNKIQPSTLGQAGRIAGISPSDITTILINLKKMNLL
jgi:tRNA uridine 5-carboxymethylaminomethyl modification enzyme